jgi:serine protease Do
MDTQTGNRKTRWVWTAVAVIAMAGVSGAAVAKERKTSSKDKTTSETPGAETGNGYIGVYLQDLTREVRKGLDLKVEKGVLVNGVEGDSPADKAGIEDGDVIVRFNGKLVASSDELRGAVRAVSPGKEAKVDLVHDGDSKTVTVTVSERPEHQAMYWESGGDDDMPGFARSFTMMGGPRLGVEAHELEDEGLASYFGAKKGAGLLVLSVDDESLAGKAGVKPGDIISKVGSDRIEDTQDVRQALKDYDQGDKFDITVIRHGKEQTLKATMDEQEHEFAFDMPGNQVFQWRAPRAPHAPHPPMAPRVFVNPGDRDELRRELNDLKQQIQELKDKLEDRNDG